MAIEIDTIAVYEQGHPQAGAETKDFMEALQDVAGAKSTRDLIRGNEQRRIKCALRVPLLEDRHLVQAPQLGRKLRKVIRQAVDAASPGDLVVVDFIFVSNSRLEIRAGRTDEMGGLDGFTFEAFFQGR